MNIYTTPFLSAGSENGYGPGYANCKCCPYGYHIDLDFVKFCENFSQSEADKTGSIKRRKDRRKQRQSIEVLLGIDPLQTYEQNFKPILEQQQQKPKVQAYGLIQDGFDDAVTDFERTLQRSKKKPAHNLPDVTAVSYTENIRRVPSTSSVSSTSGSSGTVPPQPNDAQQPDFDTISIESCGLSPTALQNIREQMALSLERTKLLEDQVKTIPDLKEQLSKLKEENRRLQLELYSEQKVHNTQLNFYTQLSNQRSQSFTEDTLDSKKKPPAPPPRKDFGVMCAVLTRNVGVGHQMPNTKTVSTATLKDLDIENGNVSSKFVSRASQTIVKEQRHAGNQAMDLKKTLMNQSSQTIAPQSTRHVAVNTKTETSDCASQITADLRTIGVSDHTINDVPCQECVDKKTMTNKLESAPISLASLSSRSKSFNLGEDLTKSSKTVACQYEPSNLSKSIQATVVSYSKSSQNELKQVEKHTQSERNNISKATSTKELVTSTKHIACQAIVETPTKEVACDTDPMQDKTCQKCENKDKDDGKKDNGQSRIPRPQVPTTPVEVRKFRRQDTYTKIYNGPTSPKLSGLDLSPKASSSELDKVKQNFKFPDVSSTSTETSIKVQESIPTSESTTSLSTHRKKVYPSKEMQGAMKVLNDALMKNPSKSVKNPSAVNIVQQEWFKMSSLVMANPLTVEDYLDAFEDMSALLLQYIVNMTDGSGNTAMHYAVSHGNFDVVSILLDSKVCDINKPNKSGYTSVMLVSLAEVKSETHANVVRRLFQLADVNIRAKQHGQTALMLAVSHGRLDMVRMLLEAGADINIHDEDGSTALMCAAEHGHIEIVKHFLSHPDCDSSITDVDGSTALTIAMEAGHRTVGVLLYTHERNHQKNHGLKIKKTKSPSPKTPSSPLPIRSSHRALTDTKTSKQ